MLPDHLPRWASVLVYVIVAAVSSALNTLLYNALASSWDYTDKHTVSLRVVVAVVAGALPLAVLPYVHHRRTVGDARTAFSSADSLASVDQVLLWLAAELPCSPDIEKGLDRTLKHFLSECADLFKGGVARGVIYVPQGEYLWPRVTLGTNVSNTFYIGGDQSKRRGIAGESYCSGKLSVTHFMERGDKWEADNPDWLPPTNGRRFPPYKSFVTIPITDNHGDRLGVLCMDSMEREIFDPPHTLRLLEKLGSRVGAILALHAALKMQRNTQAGTAQPVRRPPTRSQTRKPGSQ